MLKKIRIIRPDSKWSAKIKKGLIWTGTSPNPARQKAGKFLLSGNSDGKDVFDEKTIKHNLNNLYDCNTGSMQRLCKFGFFKII